MGQTEFIKADFAQSYAFLAAKLQPFPSMAGHAFHRRLEVSSIIWYAGDTCFTTIMSGVNTHTHTQWAFLSFHLSNTFTKFWLTRAMIKKKKTFVQDAM